MVIQFDRIRLVAICAVLLIFSFAVWWVVQPWLLTLIYGDELRVAVHNHFTVIYTIAGNRDPNVMAQVTTGKHLADLIRVRCIDCPRVQVATRIEIPFLQVLSYSGNISKVGARVEYGWHLVDTATGTEVGPCHAQAFSTVMILVRENGVWKAADGSDAWGWERDPVDDTPLLRSKYCPSN